ncbi:hypothetical protein ACVWXS_000126 [Lysinibacillus sp. TE18511]
MLIEVEAGHPQESAQSERKSTIRYGDEPYNFLFCLIHN